jgi:uncharacterized RDD family membrane protein YckC
LSQGGAGDAPRKINGRIGIFFAAYSPIIELRSMSWYFAESGRPVGPVEDDQFEAFVANGRITPEMLVWRRGMAQWQPYRSLNGTPAEASPERMAFVPANKRWCSQCDKVYPTSELAAFGASLVCPNCKPLFAQRLREGVPAVGTRPYAGFWIRVLATFIDGLILSVVALLYTDLVAAMLPVARTETSPVSSLQLILLGINLVVGLAFEVWFVGRFGATPGKMVCQIKVVRSDGRRVTYLRSLARHLAKTLDWFTLGVGFVMAVFDEDRRTLHDRICDTRVIRNVPNPLQTSGGCPECHAALPASAWNLNYPVGCPHCRTAFTALAFPAQVREQQAVVPEPASEGGEATCYFHTTNKALAACDECGRFVCSLCHVAISGQNWCPSCIVLHRQRGRLTYLDNRRMMYDNLALLLAIVTFFLLGVWPIAIVTVGATLFVVFFYWRKVSSLVPRTKSRFVVAAVLVGIELLALVMIVLRVIGNSEGVTP